MCIIMQSMKLLNLCACGLNRNPKWFIILLLLLLLHVSSSKMIIKISNKNGQVNVCLSPRWNGLRPLADALLLNKVIITKVNNMQNDVIVQQWKLQFLIISRIIRICCAPFILNLLSCSKFLI